MAWQKGGPLTVLVQNRTQTEEQLLAVDPRTGKTRLLLTEKDEAWLNLDQDFPQWLEDGSGFLWYTERNGGPEVELRNADGSLARTWVKPRRGLPRPGAASSTRSAPSTSTAIANPTESYLWRVKDGGRPEKLATGAAVPRHRAGRHRLEAGRAARQHVPDRPPPCRASTCCGRTAPAWVSCPPWP